MNILRFSLLAVLAIALSSLSATAQQLATAKVLNVTGTVTKSLANGGEEPLAPGDLLREGDAVSVAAQGSADLVFSNGSELRIQKNTSVNFATMKQQAFSGSQRFEALQADPSTSQTVLELNYGELQGHVKKLRSDSRFDVKTPMGTAAVRGTRFVVSLSFNVVSQEFSMDVINIDGDIEIQTYGGSGLTLDGAEASGSEQKKVDRGERSEIRLKKTDQNEELFQETKNRFEKSKPGQEGDGTADQDGGETEDKESDESEDQESGESEDQESGESADADGGESADADGGETPTPGPAPGSDGGGNNSDVIVVSPEGPVTSGSGSGSGSGNLN